MRFPALGFLIVSLGLASLTGCAAPASETEGDEVEASADELRALQAAEIVGSLANGETKRVEVTGKPFYRAFKLEVAAGEALELAVTSPDGSGDPQAWLLGANYQTIARATDAGSADTSARFTRTMAKAGTYYLAFRDEKSRTVTFTVSRGKAAPPPPPAPAPGCTSDAQCGGGSAMCLLDRCVTVSESSFVVDTLHGSIAAAYTPAGELKVAYETWRSGGFYSMFFGGFGTATGSAVTTSTPFLVDHAPGREPALASSYYVYQGGGVSYGTASGPVLGYHQRVSNFAVGQNAQGALFVALAGITPAPVNSTAGDKCTLWFASRPKLGSWSSLEQVDTCGWGGYRNLAVHVRADGGADIVAAPEFGDITRYHRQNPIDPWAKTSLSSPGAQGRAAFAFTHGTDGTTHLVTQNYVFTTDASKGDYDGVYMELGDAGPVRTIPLSKHREQWRMPFPDLDLDGQGNVFIQKRPSEDPDRASVVRIDRAGNVAERSLGRISTGPWKNSALAVSPSGELSLVHVADNRNVSLRRFTPVR